MEYMLELDRDSCLQLRCIRLFHKMAQERGKRHTAPAYNWKKLSITRGEWESELAEVRCRSDRARAARLWLYDNNMTYRHFYDMHRSILVQHKNGDRPDLFEQTHRLLADKTMCGLEVAAWPILYPWSRYGDTDVRQRLATGGSGTERQHYSGKQPHIRKLLSRCRAYEQEPSLAFFSARPLLCQIFTGEVYSGGFARCHRRHYVRLHDYV